MNDAPHVESPCIKVCVLDAKGETCVGCFRTLEEIGHWAAFSNAERAAVVAKLAERRRRSEEPSSAPAAWAPLRCERCGAGFVCGAKDPDHSCWCASYPSVTPTGEGASCLCPECLAAAGMR